MGKRENTVELVNNYLEHAQDKLKSSKIFLDENQYADSISRAYYVTYLAAKGILLLIGESPKTHSGVIQVFGLKIVKEGFVSKRYAKMIVSLFEAGQTSDYQPMVWFEKSDATQYFTKATRFVKKMQELFDQLSNSKQPD